MASAGKFEEEDYGMDSVAAPYRCEECGYKWKAGESDVPEEEIEDDTISYDADSENEPTVCPMCGSADIVRM